MEPDRPVRLLQALPASEASGAAFRATLAGQPGAAKQRLQQALQRWAQQQQQQQQQRLQAGGGGGGVPASSAAAAALAPKRPAIQLKTSFAV